MTKPVTYTHPDVFTRGVQEGWADPETDPTRIDWEERLRHAAKPFKIVNGRPVNPWAPTGVRYGRNQLGRWGEQLAVDALVAACDRNGRKIVMVERDDDHGWALPGGFVEPGEDPGDAAVREMREETGLEVPDLRRGATPARYVPDPRASDEAWVVTVLHTCLLGGVFGTLPQIVGRDDARRAAWIPADSYEVLTDYLHKTYGGKVFPAHVPMLQQELGTSRRAT